MKEEKVFARIELEEERLGWIIPDRIAFLKSHYQVNSLLHLSDEQIQQYLSFLAKRRYGYLPGDIVKIWYSRQKHLVGKIVQVRENYGGWVGVNLEKKEQIIAPLDLVLVKIKESRKDRKNDNS